jgi:tetratricopeptide (TPR) repeat protein
VALAELGRIYWQIGAFEKQVEADAAVAALDPGAKEARRRLADGLLQLGRAAEALEVASALHAEDPDYEDIRLILAHAESRARREAPGPARAEP